jgi:predicted PurR-regulated permease PerM
MKSLFKQNIVWIIGVLLLAGLCYLFARIVVYIVLAWVLALLGAPIMRFLQRYVRIRKWHLGSAPAAMLTILTFYLVAIGVIWMFVPTIAKQARQLSRVDYHSIGEQLEEPMAKVNDWIHSYGLLPPDESLADKTQELLLGWFGPQKLGNMLNTLLATTGDALILVGAVTFILFFFLQDNTMFEDMLHAFVPNAYEVKVQQAVHESSVALTNYFGGLVLQLTAFTAIVTTILMILGINNAFLIGTFGGLLNVIPYVGPTIGYIFGCFITISSNLNQPFDLTGVMLLKVVGAFYVTQLIDNNLLAPIIFSRSVKAHPLEIFLVTLAAAQLGGILGMVLGIPVYTLLRVIARTFLGQFKIVQRWTGEQDAQPTNQ